MRPSRTRNGTKGDTPVNASDAPLPDPAPDPPLPPALFVSPAVAASGDVQLAAPAMVVVVDEGVLVDVVVLDSAACARA